MSYDVAGLTASLVPLAPLAVATTYEAVLRGGEQGAVIRDIAGNALAQDYSWTFDVALAVPFVSIWDEATLPLNLAENDTAAVELGVKFQSTVAGYILGIRFYKGTGNEGPHVGNLWSASGQLLASAPFIVESEMGWQEVRFAAPVAIEADTTYVASYHAPAGNYAADKGYFAQADALNPPLRALADGVAGGNGVYAYGPSAFPNQSFEANNYWVDVVFSLDYIVDLEAPEVTVTLANPASELVGSVTVKATAADNQQVAGVQFYLDGAPLGPELLAPPYELEWDTTLVANGEHELTAVARDLAGNSEEAVALGVTVTNPAAPSPFGTTSGITIPALVALGLGVLAFIGYRLYANRRK